MSFKALRAIAFEVAATAALAPRNVHVNINFYAAPIFALLGADAGIGAGRVDEGEQRQPEPGRHVHQAQRLAVALRARHTEVAEYLGLGVAALLVADQHHRAAAEAAEAADDRVIVRKGAVAV